ncbi:MAG: class I adenylate-forming enzyme family protein [Pseudomonadota bacterium]
MSKLRMELQWGRLVSCYAERPSSVNDMLQRSFALSPDRIAVVDGDVRMRYRELDAAAGTLAANLAARGVTQGDRVAVMLDNRIEAVIGVIAIARLGAILVPIGTRLRRPEISHIFEDAQPVAVIHGAEFTGELPDAGPAAAMRFACGSAQWNALLEQNNAPPLPPVTVGEQDVFGILYTSGTTGRPKGAMLTHLNVVHSCMHWEDAHHMSRDERTVLCVPWSHVAGLCGVVLPFLHIGGTLVLMAEFKRRDFLLLAQTEHITHALLVPAMYGLCLLEPDLASFDLGAWRLGVYGSAPMPEPTIRRFAQAFPNLQMCNCYGATETTSPATMMPPGDGVAHAGSIGKAVPCGDIRVMDEQGRELPAGEEGELWIAGPMVVPGYWRNPDANASSFAAGYWKSGDIGAIDAQGYVRIADRKKDMINRGGFKVYPAEVESVLTGISGVIEAAVVGQPDEMLGESVIAFLNVTGDGIDETQVRGYCAARMADYKVPGRVVVGRSPLPRNANGKIQKADLRQMAAALPPLTRPGKAAQ